MKIAIVGSREFKDENLVDLIVENLCEKKGDMKCPLTIISGGAKGVDTWAEKIADGWEGLGVLKNIFKANWKDLSHPDAIIKNGKYGEYDAMAGFRRNQLIVDEADKVIAFWDGQSNGTKDTIDRAIAAGKPIDIYVRK